MPDGRAFEVVEIRQLPTKTNNFVVRINGHTGDGQTLSIDLVTKEPTEALRRCAPHQPTSAATAIASPQIANIELQSRNLRASCEFYRDILGLPCRLEKDQLVVGDFLILSEVSEEALGSGSFILTLAVTDLVEVVSSLEALPGVKYTREPGSNALWLADPDGNQVQIVEEESRKAADFAEDAPWRIVHRRGMTYELRNVTDTPKFHVQISGEGVLRPTTAKRVDGQSSIGFMGLDAMGVSDQIDVSWHRREDRSDEPSTSSGIKPS
jgi:catechol 2,3-dioxygenase-like lactoylglutathione lyase family enzyme